MVHKTNQANGCEVFKDNEDLLIYLVKTRNHPLLHPEKKYHSSYACIKHFYFLALAFLNVVCITTYLSYPTHKFATCRSQ